MNGNKIYTNRSIRPSYDKVQRNASNIHSSVGSLSTGFTSNESINKKVIISNETNNSKNMTEFEKNAMLLGLNTLGLNQVSFFGMDQNQFNNYYQNFSKNRKNINSHDLAYKVLSSIQQKYPIKKEQEKQQNQKSNFKNNLRNNIVKKDTEKQIINNFQNNKVIKKLNENIESCESEYNIEIKSKNSIVNQVIREDIIKPDKNVIINGNEIIFPNYDDNKSNKKRNNIVNQKEQNYSLQTVNIDVNDRVSNINGKSCVLLDEFILDKMK